MGFAALCFSNGADPRHIQGDGFNLELLTPENDPMGCRVVNPKPLYRLESTNAFGRPKVLVEVIV